MAPFPRPQITVVEPRLQVLHDTDHEESHLLLVTCKSIDGVRDGGGGDAALIAHTTYIIEVTGTWYGSTQVDRHDILRVAQTRKLSSYHENNEADTKRTTRKSTQLRFLYLLSALYSLLLLCNILHIVLLLIDEGSTCVFV